MIGYVCIGTNDLPRAARYYDELTALLGAKRHLGDGAVHRPGAASPTDALLTLIKPLDSQARHASATAPWFRCAAESKAQVDAVYHKALALGGTGRGAARGTGRGFLRGLSSGIPRATSSRCIYSS